MPKKGSPKSFAPGTHLFVPYYGHVHEVVVEECTTKIDPAFVYVRFLKPPAPVVGKRFANPRSVRKNSCFTEPGYARNDTLRWYRASIKDLERNVRYYRKRLTDMRESKKAFQEVYKKDFPEPEKGET